MKAASIIICTADKAFRQDQTAIMKRVALVLIEHDLSVVIDFKKKKDEQAIKNMLIVIKKKEKHVIRNNIFNCC
jgi:hypothetical protein